ncbi:aldose epimerase family protein [Thalassotalea sediminis]|uniref:aldose epimerase family protein n=1 Tax=Thalassotalea sediminis TaxID=1759089 RepID=UPI0025743685|nr:aldose epimerase family protein [Thalassotalea sediminis]
MTEIRSFLISNNNGDEVCITNYGARIIQWYTEVAGEERNIVLGYSSLADYLEDPFYHGAIVGPFANRIKDAQVTIEGQLYPLDANEGYNHLHGGTHGLSQQFWQLEQQSEQSVTLSCAIANGHDGYPGAITFSVTYSLTDEGELTIALSAIAEQPTVVGLTSHPYFNLAGIENDADRHLLHVNAEYFTEVDEKLIPTGAILPVKDTHFDFQKPRTLTHVSRDVIDQNFVIHPGDKHHATLISPDKKLQLHVSSDMPGLQVYTADHLFGRFIPRQGICLEPQFFPNSPNVSDFPFSLTTPEHPYSANISYRLVKPHDKPSD